MLRKVEARGYNLPRRERIFEWQREQEFPIIPNAEDPDCGDVYRSLKFPQQIYEDIQEYRENRSGELGKYSCLRTSLPGPGFQLASPLCETAAGVLGQAVRMTD